MVVAEALDAVYAKTASEIARRGPACWASGRCCNFERTGHRLYVTGVETAYAIVRAEAAGLGAEDGRARDACAAVVSLEQIDTARARGGCPFQRGNLCGIHTVKPLGCRVYFCDRSAQQWQQDLSERMLSELRALHDEHQIEYRYGEWREMLGYFAVEGEPGDRRGGGGDA